MKKKQIMQTTQQQIQYKIGDLIFKFKYFGIIFKLKDMFYSYGNIYSIYF